MQRGWRIAFDYLADRIHVESLASSSTPFAILARSLRPMLIWINSGGSPLRLPSGMIDAVESARRRSDATSARPGASHA